MVKPNETNETRTTGRDGHGHVLETWRLRTRGGVLVVEWMGIDDTSSKKVSNNSATTLYRQQGSQ
jgi:hypothetical protein